MKKKTKAQKRKQKKRFKISLAGLLTLLVLLIWFTGNKKNISGLLSNENLSSKNRLSTQPESDIRNVISPLLAEETFVLKFEDELPDPVYKEEAAVSAENTGGHHYKRHLLGLIIDDVGYDLKALSRLLELPFTLTVSISPDSPPAAEAARLAHQHGLKVMLHMPMQTSNPKYQQKM